MAERPKRRWLSRQQEPPQQPADALGLAHGKLPKDIKESHDWVVSQDWAKRDALQRRMRHVGILGIQAANVVETVHLHTNSAVGRMAPHQVERVDQIGETTSSIANAILWEMGGQ